MIFCENRYRHGGYTTIYLKSCLGALNKALDPELAIKVGINESSGQEPVPKR
jgi:hypothetical protein